MEKQFDRKIVLEDGSEYLGYAFGDRGVNAVCELVFNTSMVGYQEILSDPSYTYQMVVMTYPLIGNYGISDDDYESKNPTVGGLVVREYNDFPSNFRYTKTLSEVMEECHIPGISGVDTRKLTRVIREKGTLRALITDADTPLETALATIAASPVKHDAVSVVSSKKRWYSRTANPKLNVVTVDCGMKLSLIRALGARGCNVTVVPYNTPASLIESMNPDGVLISDGPGNPEDVPEVIGLVRELRSKIPLAGICLGHQIISLAYGATIDKLKFGHRGGNHPVKDLFTGKIEISTQNHSYTVNAESLAATDLKITHVNILDNTVEGVKCERDNVFSVQFHPEGLSVLPDSAGFFDTFIRMMKGDTENA